MNECHDDRCPTYVCTGSRELECPIHGGFDTCCDRSDCPGFGTLSRAEKRRLNAVRTVASALAVMGWTNVRLASEAKVDPKTINDFLAGRRWPQRMTRGRIERALGWELGVIQAQAESTVPPVEMSPGAFMTVTEERRICQIAARVADERINAYLGNQGRTAAAELTAADDQHHMSIRLGNDEDGVPIGAVEVDYFGDDVIYLDVIDASTIGNNQEPIHATVTLDAAAARAIAADLNASAEKLEQQISEASA